MKSKAERIERVHAELEKTVEVKITSSRGHDSLTVPAAEAVETIRTQCEDKKKWLYMNGTHKNPFDITTDDVMEADDILLTNGLAGGSSN
jgi:MFS superfamily sulfate permease-like transporter